MTLTLKNIRGWLISISTVYISLVNKMSTTGNSVTPMRASYGGHLGRHLGFLGPHKLYKIYAGGLINFRPSRTFWYITSFLAFL